MSEMMLVELVTPQQALRAAALSTATGNRPIDVLSPQPIEGIDEYLAPGEKRASIGWIMMIAAVCGASFAYLLQWYSAVIDFPLLAGGRPLNAWQVFLIICYEAAILFAGVGGFIGLLWICRLPKLYHPLFDLPVVERASSDRYLLVYTGSNADLDAVTRDLVALNPHFHRPEP